MTQEPIKLDYGVNRDDEPRPPEPWRWWEKWLLLFLISIVLLWLIAGLIRFLFWCWLVFMYA